MESGGIPFRGAAPAEARKIASLDKNRKFVDSESMAVYMNVIKIRSIFVLKMLPESSEARLRRDVGAAAIHLRRIAPEQHILARTGCLTLDICSARSE